jgi:ATP-dependent helicase Lhr and Lhr-like helicase
VTRLNRSLPAVDLAGSNNQSTPSASGAVKCFAFGASPIAFLRHRADEPAILSLAGRSWAVTSLEWPKRIAYVVPADEKGKSQWLGTRFGFSFKLCGGVHDLLTEDAVSDLWSSQAREKNFLATQRVRFSGSLDRTADAVLVQGKNEIRWFTFAGNILNLALADTIRGHGCDDVRDSD